jgi:hypothetical protein
VGKKRNRIGHKSSRQILLQIKGKSKIKSIPLTWNPKHNNYKITISRLLKRMPFPTFL